MNSLQNKFFAGFLLIFLSAGPLFAETSLNVAKYENLLKAIRETRAASEVRVERVVEQEEVREAWETGKLIQEHILLNKERAEYGKKVIVRLAKDLGTSNTELKYMLEFAKAYPTGPAPGQLSWAHYRELLSMNDVKAREEIIQEAGAKKWSQKQLRSEIKKRKFSQTKSPETKLAAVKPGKLNTYRIVRAAHGVYKGELVVDLGFSAYYRPEQDLKLKEGEFVAASRLGSVYTLTQDPSLTLKDLYTYSAEVIQVVDGDTFHASFDLGFGVMLEQRVRLLRVDAPEILTSEGKEAKAALEKLLAKDKGRVLIRSAEVDQHGRPLAIVWAGGVLVDQKLAEQDLAEII